MFIVVTFSLFSLFSFDKFVLFMLISLMPNKDVGLHYLARFRMPMSRANETNIFFGMLHNVMSNT